MQTDSVHTGSANRYPRSEPRVTCTSDFLASVPGHRSSLPRAPCSHFSWKGLISGGLCQDQVWVLSTPRLWIFVLYSYLGDFLLSFFDSYAFFLFSLINCKTVDLYIVKVHKSGSTYSFSISFASRGMVIAG